VGNVMLNRPGGFVANDGALHRHRPKLLLVRLPFDVQREHAERVKFVQDFSHNTSSKIRNEITCGLRRLKSAKQSSLVRPRQIVRAPKSLPRCRQQYEIRQSRSAGGTIK